MARVVTLQRVYQLLFKAHGAQHWWPGDTPFEIMTGAILTQNTAWSNVEKAIANLKRRRSLSPQAIIKAPPEDLAACLKPSGYFNIKTRRLKAFCAWYCAAGGYRKLHTMETGALRKALLAVKGIGPETADDMLLYAFDRPVFVIDAYTRRLFARLGVIDGTEGYEHLRALFEQTLAADATLYNEYHALIVRHAKETCRVRPLCTQCGLRRVCRGSEQRDDRLDKRR
ncbi:MAG: endonuclease [Gammaproteobacteria bacterium RBG_16_57_12]|nr:MAG: endonuclease [Gammaproteobacteria bacterium RBG_16_57_12]